MKILFVITFFLLQFNIFVYGGNDRDDIVAYFHNEKSSIAPETEDLVYKAISNLDSEGDKDLLFSIAKTLSNKDLSIGHWLMGWCYEAGEGCKFDHSLAFQYHTKAANAKNPFSWAFKSLADCYYYGFGTDKDYKQALCWYEKAIEKIMYDFFLSDSYFCKGVILQYGGDGIEKEILKACNCYEKAAILGHAIAAYNLSNRYLHGEGVEVDYKKSFYWREKAAINGDVSCQYMIGMSYVNGLSIGDFEIVPNREKGIFWLKESAANGNVDAMKELNKLGL